MTIDNLVLLPKGWIWAELRDLALNPTQDIVDGPFGSNLKASEYIDEGIPIIRLQNIDRNEFIRKNIKFIDRQKAEFLDRHSFLKGDIVITKLGDPLGKACLVPDFLEKGIIVADIVRVRNHPKYSSRKFLIHLINSTIISEQLESNTKGTTRPRVNLSHVRNLRIPLPPLNEQRRIVSTIEQLTDRSHKARTALEDVPKLIAQFRQSVLAAAFRGDLTADWREKNPDVEPASELLERIKKTLPKASQKKLEDELPDPFNISDGWMWASLSSICLSISDGDHQPPPKASSGIPFLTISNISSGSIDFSNTYYVPQSYYDKIQENRKARKGDIIYSVVGSYGIPVLLDSDREFCFQRHIAIIKPHKCLIGKYILFALKSRFVFDQATRVATGTTQLTVTLSGLRRIKIPLISVPEQILIIKRIEALFEKINLIEEQYRNSFNEFQILDQSILTKAFRGELVPQDPNDEPAAVLLDRIRAEREQTSTLKQHGKTTRKNSSKQLSINGLE
jgi:type I restriction enzyme S subunit